MRTLPIAITLGAAGLTLSLLPMRMNAQDLSNPILNPFMQPGNTTIYYGSGDVDSSGVVDESDYQAIENGVQNDMADVNGDGIVDNSDAVMIQDYVDGWREYLPAQTEFVQTEEEIDYWSQAHANNDSVSEIPPGPDWKSGDYAFQFADVNSVGYFEGDAPEKYDLEYNGRWNQNVYNVFVVSDKILGGGHGAAVRQRGGDLTKLNNWSLFETQNNEINVQPSENSWNFPYESKIWIARVDRFSLNGTRGFYTILGFNIDENGNDSLIYQDPYLITKRPAMPRENLIAEMNEEGIYQIPKRQLVWHLNDSLEFRILTDENVDASFNDSSMVLTGLENYFGSANVSWDVYNGQVTENGNLEVIINNVPDAPMVSVRDTSTTQRGRFDLIGESSDPDDDIASYSWEQLSGPAVSVRDSDKSTANFDLQGEGVYNFKYTVTDSTGLYDSDTLTVDASVLRVNNVANLPKEYSLGDNYPNPFNPSTTIEYSIPIGGKVSLDVYDLNGRTVRVLVREFKTAGSYTIEFDAADLASGLYFLKMQVGDFKATSKMMYLK